MSVLLLVRHGQASWGAEDYDVLSDLGEAQARVLGEALAKRGLVPDTVVHGAMVRQRRTAELAVEAAGWSCEVTEDVGWDEMNHVEVLSRHPAPFEGRPPSPQEFQAWFEAATDRWAEGENDSDYAEPFLAFTDRVVGALGRAVDLLDDREVVLVFTSGGPISWATAHLAAAGAATYRRLAPVVVNASVTKIVTGRRGTTLVSFNDHSHLDGADSRLLTYR